MNCVCDKLEEMKTDLDNEFQKTLSGQGLKVTTARILMMKTLAAAEFPKTSGEISKNLGRAAADPVTVYRNLEVFEKAGLVRRTDFQNGQAYFELIRVGHSHHHHLVCRDCGKIEDVSGCLPKKMEKSVLRNSQKFGEIDSHSLEFFGRCKSCLKN